jgi:hypothetical protein
MTRKEAERKSHQFKANLRNVGKSICSLWRDELMRKLLLGVVVLAVCGMMVAPAATAKKDQPQPPSEPTGDLVITSNPQLIIKVPNYVRQYDWVNGEFSHTWSGTVGDNHGSNSVIGDVDNDGEKEIVATGTIRTALKGNKYSYAHVLKVWNDGDASDAPSISKQLDYGTGIMEIGDVDKDGKAELVLSATHSDFTAEVWSCDGSDCSKEASISALGMSSLTVADADNDGYPEIIMGQGTGDYYYQPVIADYNDGVYSIIPLPMASKMALDEISVGDIDGNSGNELFGVDMSGTAHVWRYSNNKYTEIWTKAVGDYCMNTEIADINGEGKNEIAFTQFNAMKLVLFKYDGSDSWSQLGAYNGANGGVSDAMVSADLDGDGDAELVVVNHVWDWDGTVMKNIQDLNPNKDRIYDVSIE